MSNTSQLYFVRQGSAGFPGYGGPPPPVAQDSSEGVASTVSRSDHTHGAAPWAPQTVATSSADIGAGVEYVEVTYDAGLCSVTLPTLANAPVGTSILLTKRNTSIFGIEIVPDSGSSINDGAVDASVSPVFFDTPASPTTANPACLLLRTGAASWVFL